jgi:hypothetical protein
MTKISPKYRTNVLAPERLFWYNIEVVRSYQGDSKMNWLDIQFAQDRHKEFLREAEQQRLIQAARSAKKSPQPVLSKLRDVRLRQSQPPLKPAQENS